VPSGTDDLGSTSLFGLLFGAGAAGHHGTAGADHATTGDGRSAVDPSSGDPLGAASEPDGEVAGLRSGREGHRGTASRSGRKGSAEAKANAKGEGGSLGDPVAGTPGTPATGGTTSHTTWWVVTAWSAGAVGLLVALVLLAGWWFAVITRRRRSDEAA
jgi:hypothetical protein